jgi:hypothetical protein
MNWQRQSNFAGLAVKHSFFFHQTLAAAAATHHLSWLPIELLF